MLFFRLVKKWNRNQSVEKEIIVIPMWNIFAIVCRIICLLSQEDFVDGVIEIIF